MIILIDGHSIAFRAFYALPETLVTKDGFPTNVIHGFLMMLSKLVKDYEPEQIIVTWDISKTTFRSEIFPDYKANRTSSPEIFKVQIKSLQQLLKNFNIPQVTAEGFEADDVLGSLAFKFNKENKEVHILTGDRDSFQLINNSTKILFTRKGISNIEVFDQSFFEESFQISTEQYIEYLALKGDPSDNIPGVPGIGEKTAKSLLIKYKTISNILDNVESLSPKIRDSLIQNKELLELSRKLATIKKDLKLELPTLTIHDSIFFNEKILNNCIEDINSYELNRFLGTSEAKKNETTNKINSIRELDKKTKLQGKYIVFLHNDYFYFTNGKDYGKSKSIGIFQEVISVNSQNIALFDSQILDIKNFIALDCILFLINPSNKPDSILNVCKSINILNNLDKKSDEISFLNFFHENFKNVIKILSNFNKDKISLNLYKEIDFPMLEILSSMEKNGINVSLKKMKELSNSLSVELKELQKKCFSLSGIEFNLNSPKQLSEVLFQKLNLPIIKKTPSGAPSTDASVLEELSINNELPAVILKYRELEKIRSTYVDGLIPEVSNEEKIHTHYNLFGAATGRLSSEKPNLQNIPNKTELGQKIRDFFIALPNHKFVISDYSQIELRVLAHLSNDKEMIKILQNVDSDIHSETASRIFNVDISKVDYEMRRKAKEVNFGLIYGMEAFGLSKSLNIEQKEASKLIENYFSQFPSIRGYLEEVVKSAEEKTYTSTLLGRKRYINELSSSSFQIRSMGKRIAMNAPIQGTASDIMKKAMVNISKKIENYDDTKILLQIHDEIVVESSDVSVQKIKEIVEIEMKNAARLKVPLFVNTKVATTLANFNN